MIDAGDLDPATVVPAILCTKADVNLLG